MAVDGPLPQAGLEAGAGRRSADGRDQPARPQPVEKGVAGVAMHKAHVPGIIIG